MAAPSNNALVCDCVATASGHSHVFSAIVSAGDFLYAASSSSSDAVLVWELPKLAPSGCLRSAVATAIAVAKDYLFVAHHDRRIRIWRRCVPPLKLDGAPIHHRSVGTLPSFKDRLWKSLSQTNYVQVRRHHKKLWIEHADAISALAFNEIQKVLYSASWDRTVKVWRISDLKCLESIRAHDDAINALAVCSKSSVLYTASADGKIKAWRKDMSHRLLATLDGGHRKLASVNALALNESRELLISAASDGMLAIWGKRKGQEHFSNLLHKLSACHSQAILCLCTCDLQDGILLFSGSADKTAKVWKVDAHDGSIACLSVLKGHTGAVKSISAVPNSDGLILAGRGCLVYTASSDKSIKAWLVFNPHHVLTDSVPRKAEEKDAVAKEDTNQSFDC